MLKRAFLGIIIITTLLLIPFFNNNLTSYAEYGEGVGCTASGGRPGVCWDRQNRSCGTYYDAGWYCPGDDSVQCCVNSQVACSAGQNAACHNRYMYPTWLGGGANNGNSYSCTGSWSTGLCPGPADVQCCLPMPPPTNVTASCSPSGTSVTVNWTRPSGYTYSYARIHDRTTNTECSYSGVISSSSYSCNTAIPGHQYSYWVHTTNSGGNPWSTEVPTAHTAYVTCPIPACGDAASPTGSVLSTGVFTSASSVYNNNTATYGPANTVDGVIDQSKFWEANGSAPQWIELNLGAPQEVTGIKLHVRQGADNFTTHQILTGSSPAPTTIRRTLSCYTRNGQVINANFSPRLTNTQYIRINTTAHPSWIGWTEITVYGSAPGAQTTTPGIIFSGRGSANFGQGSASPTNWVVGGLTFPEVYSTASNVSTTSYDYILEKANRGKIPITNLTSLSTCTNLSNCTLPSSIPSGVYRANGNVRLNGFAFPLNRNFVFLINGNLTILGNIIVPNGSTAFFSSNNDIIIDRNVGTATNLFPLPAGQLQGIYSADRDFRIEGINDCITGKDKMLNVEGAIVTNAFGSGGNFRMQRDLCGDNPKYPTLTVRPRLDMIFNLPEFLMQRRTTFREDAP